MVISSCTKTTARTTYLKDRLGVVGLHGPTIREAANMVRVCLRERTGLRRGEGNRAKECECSKLGGEGDHGSKGEGTQNPDE